MKQLWLGLIVILVLFLSACSNENSRPDVDALVYENAKPLSDFTLNDQRGELVTKQQFLGQWNLVFLGYTSCPDICPLTLAKLNAVYKNLQADYPLQVWFLSVDPKRDTPAKRKQYIDYFNPDFLAVSGEHKHLFPVVRELGLIYAISDSSESEYAVDHSASVAMVDQNGAVRAIFKPEFKQGSVPLINATTLTEEFKKIADYYKN
ncbi:SCO family protein [Pseudoalteromonas sp. AS84]|uniref:SCO family protein n=1 Tax=Pseudoalteromonas arctica TaxID=394751 RepID=A0A7X9YH05_9GAMM|nr:MULTISPECIES: SCO family protein [Pseudoalteromonas]HDY92803.1 SCO family protein [Pseudoalteromonas sp.]MBA6411320.1 SCO family protein [Pseudoalteromonas sp. 5Ae-yellow]MBH0090874.1 SCO family protein [Pseudoalteromonas sp. NSLLW218]MDN3393222.1 SCO family protein [Pseudoalteromonas sp. APC 3691]NMF49950.1 SCO family protein [Pseudoalteromonas arctica]